MEFFRRRRTDLPMAEEYRDTIYRIYLYDSPKTSNCQNLQGRLKGVII